LGKEQLRDLCTVLYDVRIDAIYSSPLERARATAKAIAERQSLAVHVRDDLSEVDFGEWTGKTFAELEGTPEWRRYNRYRSTAQIPGGEHPATLAARATRALDDIQRVHPGHTVAVRPCCGASAAHWISTMRLKSRQRRLPRSRSLRMEPR
jgi:probable phosphoglycerate mutase